ncbi:hypothetical protein K443DRAFT_679420 [Laccaria amethystina LaAM-08-1]|uniref:Uncharacterized protein n=1 Tax=Laccaria amethystina LaAM-08-1 TaxID=1095629 RepID=A0A0C9XW45_9AGAR|nr:hypothetical protein K443DRAFT_679420 [Laccaria amethystina LaAM-08-1]
MNLETRPQGDMHDTLRPPETFSFDEVPVRWHPKITVYRLVVLLTTICLGVGKAITSARGAVVVPITLEWVSGVAVFVLLYGIGLYDEDHRQHMKWLFNQDLAPYLWLVSYRTDEVALPAGFHFSRHPPITGYRIAITASVPLFGLAKAMFGYLGYSLAANTFDWVFGVIVTTALYCIGLYENNSLDLFPMFFTTDHGPSLRRAFFTIPMYSLGISLSLGVIYAATQTLNYQWNHQDKFRYLVPDPNAEVPFLDSAHDVSVNLMIAEVLMFDVALGPFGLYYTFSFMKKAVFPKGLRQAIRRVLNIKRADELTTFLFFALFLFFFGHAMRGSLIL